jgi:hypothetical protein
MTSVEKIQQEIAEIRAKLVAHPVYHQIQETEDLKIFMQHHVFAVWDFMSLLKSLQKELTCVETPWLPVGTANTRFLINEIVVGEESDIDENGIRISHFELYLQAMQQCGADTQKIEKLLAALRTGQTIKQALENVGLSESIKNFVNYTFEVIESGKPHVQAAVFTFGREDLIPEMFMEMVKDLNENSGGQTSIFKYYLERHIEVDGDHHSHLALQMTDELIAGDALKTEEALTAVKQALEARIGLWDGVVSSIKLKGLILN